MIYDSLGGEHRLSINYFKVQVNSSGIYPTANDSNGNQVGYNQETTDWYAQYILEDYNDTLGKWVKSGALYDAPEVGLQNQNAYGVTSALTFDTAGAVVATQTNFIDDARNDSAGTKVAATPTEAKNALDATSTFGSIYQPGTSTARVQVDIQKSTYDVAMSMGATVSQANIASAAAFGSYGIDVTDTATYPTITDAAKAAAQAAYDQAIKAKNAGGLGMTNTEALSAAGVAYSSLKDLADADGDYAGATPPGASLLTGDDAKDNALMAFSAINFALGPLTSTDTDGTTSLDTTLLGLQVDDGTGTGTLTAITPNATVTFGGAIINDKQRDVNLFAFNQSMDDGYSSTSANMASLFKIAATASAAEHVPSTQSEAFEAAYQTALSVGLTQSQASQAAKASYDAYASAESFNAAGSLSEGMLGYLNPAQEAFNAAFGPSGSVPSISGAYVHAYRFNSDGKILDFNEKGNFAAVAGNTTIPDKVNASMSWYLDNPNPAGGVGTTEALTFDVDLSSFTQYGGSYNVRGVSQDGYKVGDLVGVVVNSNGMIEARYSNGRSDSVSRVALANFPDLQGMEKLGSQTWAESFASGPRSLGQPQESGFASIQSGALEYSNVDVTGELVNMIFMQKMYQASAQVISTDKQLTQTILQL
jgi:flagellar hook-basal body protein